MEPKSVILSPEVGCESFEAAGVTYTRTDTLTLGRAILLQRFQTELQFNMYLPTVQQTIVQAIADFNGLKFVDGSAKLKQLADGTDIVGSGRLREADICALFYNAPSEDAAADNYSEVVKAKTAAWRAAGVDATFFTGAAWWLLLYMQNHSLQAREKAQALLPTAALPTSLPS
jgi:hypothetical protein